LARKPSPASGIAPSLSTATKSPSAWSSPPTAPENLKSWPTTFFPGRDGRVRGVHAGFAGRASGEFYTQTKREVTLLVENLLAESTSATAR
jgi:hypothetical protein